MKINPLRALRLVVYTLVCLTIMSLMLSSCVNTRPLIYMQGAFDTSKLSQTNVIEAPIQKGDLISIIVYSDNPEATKIYNQALITTASAGGLGGDVSSGLSGSSPSSPGYQVDENGNIEFQGLGLLHVDGLTRNTLKDTLSNRLNKYLSNVYFNIRFLNHRFTMLGEVSKPGIYSIPGDHLNLLEALGLAGDMTFYGRRDNILVIRDSSGKRAWARLDLTKPEIMGSPYFYLQQNDVVIFEPNKKKVAANDQTTLRNLTIATTLISTFALLYTIFR